MSRNSRRIDSHIWGASLPDANRRLPPDTLYSPFLGLSKRTQFFQGPVSLPRVAGPRIFRPPNVNKAVQGSARPFSFLRIAAPHRVYFCLSRKRRREVLHAFRIAGKRGIGKGKRVRRTQNSQYRC